MIASSPVRHDATMQPNPVEVQSYQAPWKALSDFAMQNELEQAPFQQLVSAFPVQPMVTHAMMHHQQVPDEEDDTVVFA